MPRPARRVAGVVLAAGAGSRLGGGKLLLPWRGRPLLAHVLDAAFGADCLSGLVMVLGNDAEAVRAAAIAHFPDPGIPLRFVENPLWADGQSTSLQCGVAALAAGPEDAALVMLGDQPLVRAETVAALARAHASLSAPPPAVAPVYQGRRGNPVLLSRELFPAVMALRGDIGARDLLRRLGEGLLLVPVDDPGVVRDIDTPGAYADLRAEE